MKKLYTLVLSALFCLSAAASGRQLAEVKSITLDKKEIVNAVKQNGIGGYIKLQAPTHKAPSINDYVGEYEYEFVSLLNSDPSSIISIAVLDEASNIVGIQNMIGNITIPAVIDVENGYLAIPNKMKVAEDEDGDVLFYLKGVTSEGMLVDGATDEEASFGVLGDGEITFPEMDVWALGDPDNEALGWYTLTYMNKFIKATPDDPTAWEDYCEGIFEDGWMMPAFELAPSDYPWTVSIQRNVNDHNLYRLYNPYSAVDCPIAEYAAGEGFITFNLSDPTFVTVLPKVYSGFENQGSKLYFYNLEGFYMSMGLSKEQIISGLASEGVDFTPSSLTDKTVTITECGFGDTKACNKFYTWQDQNGNSLADMMNAKIIFDKAPDNSGVTDITVDANTSVEYYNLQGVRLDKPATGVCIRVEGNKATKVYVK